MHARTIDIKKFLIRRVLAKRVLINAAAATVVLGALGICGARSVAPGVVPGADVDIIQAVSATGPSSTGATGPATSASATPSGSPSASPSGAATPSRPAPARSTASGRPAASTARTAVLVGAGDIATCGSPGAEETAKLLGDIGGTIFTAGDNSQDDGEPEQFRDCFDPTWGRYRSRIRPVPGNHDYRTEGAFGYFGYYGKAAGTPGRGYYSYDVGNWHVVALNSNCDEIGGCGKGSDEEAWLRADLAASSRPCTMAYWHHSLFTSAAEHEGTTAVLPLFQALYDHGAEIVVSGHNHVYERFAPQNPDGERDDARGVRQFTVGTGGTSHYEFGEIRTNSQARNNDTYGVLKLTLKPRGYDWAFVPVGGEGFTDQGSASCH